MKVRLSSSSSLKPIAISYKSRVLGTICLLFISQFSFGQTGTWTALTNQAPHDNQGVMLLLTDGTVICSNTSGTGYGTGWDKLTPDIHGSYANGTWTSIANMNYDRFAFSSQVLTSGKVYVAGGEYGTGGEHGEVYDPVANTWTTCGNIPSGWNIYDAPSELLYNGTVLEGPEIGANGGQMCNSIELWSPTTLDYTTDGKEPENHDEALWLKLPDSTVLTVGMPYPNYPSQDSSCRYQPKTNTWLVDAMLPNNIYDQYGFESGCGFLLPNGKAIFFGAAQYNAIYTPSGNSTTKGTWAAAANFPQIGGKYVGQPDAPGAMMVNGHILLAVSPIGTSNRNEFLTPTYFLEYDYTTNAFTQVTATIPTIGADDLSTSISQNNSFLDLPDGTVLVGMSGISNPKQYYIYTPGSAAIAAGKPTINSILPDACPSYKITGKLFNGISEGASFGDDAQMSTNFPLVRLSNGTDVYYAKTTNWNRIGAVMTDSLEDTAIFTLPATLPAGTYSLVVVANGFASNPVIFETLGIAISSTTNEPCGGSSVASITSVAQGGISPYTYSWSPSGGTNSTASNLSAGTYTITVKDANGCTATATATITQPVPVSITIASFTNTGCSSLGTATANAATGGTSPYTYSWSPASGSNLTVSNLSAGSYTITATDNNSCTGSTSVTIGTASSLRDSLATSTNPLCNAGTGSATIGVKGGTSPYTFSWSPNTNTTATASTITAGSYTVNITDNNGCTSSVMFNLTQPTAITVTQSIQNNVNCYNGNNGSASLTVTGGISPYTYSWSGGGTNYLNTTLSAGTFTISITDNNGCNATTSVSITQPASALIVTGDSVNETSGCNGAASVTASGGTSPYTYSWTTGGQTTDTINGQCAGSYCCNITDNNGCTQTICVTINLSTGTNEVITKGDELRVYPDPNNGNFTIDGLTRGQLVNMYNYFGQEITSISANDATLHINISDNANGVYLIRVLNKDGSVVAQKKMVKTN